MAEIVAGPPPAPPVPFAPRHLVPVLLACVSFAVSWTVALRIFDAHAVVQRDVWFLLDSDDFLDHRFADVVRHPNLELYLALPLSAAQRVLAFVGIGAESPIQMQHGLMLLAAPIASTVRTYAAYRALARVIAMPAMVVLLCVLDIASFASVALASMPETFALTAALLAVAYWLFVEGAGGEPIRWPLWLVLGTLATGLTVTNIAPVAILFGATLLARGTPRLRTVAATVGMALGAVAITAALVAATTVAKGDPLLHTIERSAADSSGAAQSAAVSQVAVAIAHTLIAPPAVSLPGEEPPWANPDHDRQFVLPARLAEDWAGWWRALLTAIVLAAGTAGYLQRAAATAYLLPAAAILVTNFVMHLFWGEHYFVYSLHWAFSMVWIVAGVAFLPGRAGRLAMSVVALFALITAVNSAVMLEQLLAVLEAS